MYINKYFVFRGMGKTGEIRVSLTREMKSKLCIYSNGHNNLNQNKLKQSIKNTFKLDLNRSTISKILQDMTVLKVILRTLEIIIQKEIKVLLFRYYRLNYWSGFSDTKVKR